MGESFQRTAPGLGLILRRSFVGRCPNCGVGKLFASYLKPVGHCSASGEPYGHIRSDDAAPWLTILVVGHISVSIILETEIHADWPMWVSMTVWPLLVCALTLVLLPRLKGMLIGILWFTGAPGSERD